MEVTYTYCFRRLLIAVAAIGFIAIVAGSSAPTQSTNDFLPIVMILSDTDSGLYSNSRAEYDPMYTMLKCSIESELTVIVSTPVLHWLTKRTAEGRNPTFDWAQEVKSTYKIYVTKEKKFAVLIPQKYANKLDSLGFNTDYLGSPLAAKDLKTFFLSRIFASQSICPQELENLLRKPTLMNPVCPKYFYITGHGMDSITEPHFMKCNPVMAQMPIYDMVNVLQILNDVNTRMVYLLTCYAAGSNLVRLQNLLSGAVIDERCKSMKPLNFPLLIQCTMDTASTRIAGRYFSLPGLFNAMVRWKNLETSDCSSLEKELGAMYAKMPADERFSNFPTLRLPGSDSHFHALTLSSTAVIQAPITSPEILETPHSVEMIQLYPADVRKLKITMVDKVLSNVMSRVPGRAHHFIGELNIKASAAVPVIVKNVFLNGLDADGEIYYGIADKAWFIEKVVSNGKKIAEGLVVCKGSLKKARPMVLAVFRGATGNYYRLHAPLGMYTSIPQAERIDEETYMHIIARIFWETRPAQDALNEVTNGSESIQDHDQLFKDFCTKLSLNVDMPLTKEFIEEDFQDLKEKKLAKENYINYVAYTHDKELIEAIVDATIDGRIFSTYDSLSLLVYLIDDGYPALALEQIHKLAQQNDTDIESIVVDTFSYLIEEERCKQLLVMYDDIVKCLKNILTNQKSPHSRFIKIIQNKLANCMVTLINNDCEQVAVQKINDLLESSELGLQAIGTMIAADIKESGYANNSQDFRKTLKDLI